MNFTVEHPEALLPSPCQQYCHCLVLQAEFSTLSAVTGEGTAVCSSAVCSIKTLRQRWHRRMGSPKLPQSGPAQLQGLEVKPACWAAQDRGALADRRVNKARSAVRCAASHWERKLLPVQQRQRCFLLPELIANKPFNTTL